MFLSEDQIGELEHIVRTVGYNGGFNVKRPLFKRRGPINVCYIDHNRQTVHCTISSVGGVSNVRKG